jgi:hypothetical protein
VAASLFFLDLFAFEKFFLKFFYLFNMNFFNLFHITPIIKGNPHNGFGDFKRLNLAIKTTSNNSF